VTDINLYDYLDEVYKSPFNKSLCETILNKFVSSPDLYHQHGTVWNGKQNGTPVGTILEPTSDRQAYQLQPTVVTQNGSEITYRVYRDFLLKAQSLGIDVTSRVAEWGSALQFNYAPPIDLDKLANYSDYYWYDVKNPGSTPQYITIENQCRKAKGIVDQYQVVLNTRGSTIEVQYIDISTNTFTVNNNYAEMFIDGFVFFIKNSTNISINQRYWTTKSSVYDITANTTIITVVDPIVQQFPMIATIDLAPLLTVFESKRNCKCYGSVGWDYAQWDDNQVGSLIWNTNMMLQITSDSAPSNPAQFQLWYDTIDDVLYQFNNEWYPVQNAFSIILSQTAGTHNWDLDTNCDPLVNAWTSKNYWLHINEVPNFEIAQKAQLPIIEYSIFAQLNNWAYYKPNWYYRSTIYSSFELSLVVPTLFELMESIDCTFVNTTTFNLSATAYDLTNVFVPGYQFSLNGIGVTVVASSYIQCASNTQLFQTQVVIDGYLLAAKTPITILPLFTSTGDKWEGYNQHWVFQGAANPVPCDYKEQNIYQVTFDTKTFIATDQSYLYSLNNFGEQITIITPSDTSIYKLDPSLQQLSLYGTNSVRVYLNNNRIFGAYNEIPLSANGGTYVGGIQFDNILVIKPYDIIEIYVGPDAQQELGYNNLNIRTTLSDSQYKLNGNVNVSAIRYKIVDQLVTTSNQYPLFDIFDVDSTPLDEVSSIFKYATSDAEPINSYIGERIISSSAPINFTFEQSLITEDNGPLRSYRLLPQGARFNYFWYDSNNNEVKIWDGNCWVTKVSISTVGYIAPIISTTAPVASSFQTNPYYYCSSTQQGYVYNQYVNKWIPSAYTYVGADDPTLTTIWRPGLTLQEYTPQYVNSDRVPVNIGSVGGLWEEPNQLLYNPMHQNLHQITYMDLYDHCNSIVNAQTAIPGLSNQVNTYYAKMSNQIDFGVGGTIREYNGSYDTLISSLNINQLINTKSVMQFAEVQYQFLVDMFIDTYVKHLPTILTSNSNKLYTNLGKYVITSILNTYQELSFSNDVYFDSTAYDPSTGKGMRNWISTLPIFGFVLPTVPYIINDPYTNINQLVCHDGHRYNLGMNLFTLNSICDNIISTTDPRTLPTTSTFGIKSQLPPPQTISEFVGAFNINSPVSGKWWYQITDTQLLLYFFSVPLIGNSYANYQPVGYPIGTLWLDTESNTLRTNNGIDWVPVTIKGDGIITSGWTPVDISLLLSDSLLQVENNLYDISMQTPVINESDYIKTSNDKSTYYQYMINSFLQFARNTQTYDYNTNTEYNVSDPFTWNYTNSIITNYPVEGYSGTVVGSCWQNLYQQLFNTPYPHLEPWKLQGFNNIPAWWMGQYSSNIPSRKWDPQMWTNILNGVLPAGTVDTIAPVKYYYVPVNITSQIIGNYPPDSLLPPYFVPTNGIQSVFANYSQIINPSSNYTFYNPSPIFWAWTQSIDFQYSSVFDAFLMQPVRMFHLMWGNKFIKCNHLEVDDRTKVVFAHQNTVFHGDMIANTTTYASSGLNQWFVDYIRFYSYDLNATDLVDYWINWNVTLGYQTSGLLDTSTLVAYSPFISITHQDYTVGYKKTDNIISLSSSSINLIANHVPPKYITYNNQNEWVFTVTTPSSNLPGPMGYYGVQNYPVSISTQNNSLLVPFMFNINHINTATNCFEVKTDVTSYSAVGSTILVANTVNTNGVFTITSSQYNPLLGVTSIYVTQTITLPIGSPDYYTTTGKLVFISLTLPFETGDTVYISSTKELPPPLQSNYPYVFVKWTFNGFVLALNQADVITEKFISIVPTHNMGTLTVGKSIGQFISLGGANTQQTWHHFKIDTNVVNYAMPPFTIHGVQNLVNFFDGYKYVLENDIGILTTDTAVDPSTGNANGWQNEIEKAINWAYSLQNAKIFDLNMYPVIYSGNNQFEFSEQFIPTLPIGSTVCFSSQQSVPSPLVDGVPYYIVLTGTNTFEVAYTYLNALAGNFITISSNTTTPLYIYEYIQQNSQLPMTEVNPYKQSIGLTSKFGILATLSENVNVDLQIMQGISDQYGNTIPPSLLNVLRNDNGAEISIRPQYPDIHLGTINAVFNGYEHIVSFNDATTTGNLIFNPYLGLTISSILLDFYRSTQANFKPDMGGYFIFNDTLIRNYETSTLNIRDYFATFRLSETNIATTLARQMIGFYSDIEYMTEFDVPVASQFEFWKGLIHNKGTEAAVMSFLNSSEYTDGYIDEYWAIQIAEYGDSHKNVGIKILTLSSDSNYSDLMFKFTTDVVQPNTNFINITPVDQTRWYDYPRVAQVLTKDFNEYKLLQ
jgi:hypothetical protein